MMYDDLTLRLRDAAKMSEALAVLLPHGEGNATAKLYKEAANAIDELQERCIMAETDLADYVEAQKYMGKPYWIPTSDCLPTIGEEVLTLGPNGGMESGFYRGLCRTRKDKWDWKKHTVRTVKFWMPRKALPEPPKEDEA